MVMEELHLYPVFVRSRSAFLERIREGERLIRLSEENRQ